MKKIYMYTDGACKGNPGAGGYACILVYGDNEKLISGGEKETTNNRMELSAVIAGLSALKEPCEVEICSDSKYVVSAINEGWLRSWIKNGWKKSDKKHFGGRVTGTSKCCTDSISSISLSPLHAAISFLRACSEFKRWQ